jgi:hypothetical protein
MSLSLKAIDRLFERLAATYGAQWTRQWQDVPMSDVKTAWAHELAVFENSLPRLAWALENLPPRCPNVIEFKALCRQAPAPELPRLPEPQADPERVARELAKLDMVKAATKTGPVDHKAWAKRIMARYNAGDKLNVTTVRFAREALGISR